MRWRGRAVSSTGSAIKQVDRLLSNAGVVVWELFAPWVREMVGQREAIVVAMDWTDFDADNQATLALNLVTRHGRATPLPWLTVDKDELKDQRNDFEDLCLCRLKALLPEDVAVTILADRGFGDVKLFEFLDRLGFGYVIRFRGNVQVAAADGGRARRLGSARAAMGAPAARRQGHGRPPQGRRGGLRPRHGHERGVASGRQRRKSQSAGQIVKLYAKRWTIEPGFRDSKDLRFGMGLSALRIGDPQRRDRLLMLNALAILLLTLLAAAKKPRHGPIAQNQHGQTPRPFVVPPGLPALRPHPQHARAKTAAARRQIRGIATPKQSLHCKTFGLA